MKKSKANDESLLRRLEKFLLNHDEIYIASILIPWVAISWPVWTLKFNSLVVPLNNDIFESIFMLTGGYRIVVPQWAMHPSLFLLSFIGPALLLALFFLLRHVLPGKKLIRNLVAFNIVAGCYFLAPPGESPSTLSKIFYALLLLSPLLSVKPQPIRTWFIFTFGVLLGVLSGIQFFTVFWMVFSFGIAHSFHFLAVDQGHLSMNVKRRPLKSTSYLLGACLLLIWAIAMARWAEWPTEIFSPSRFSIAAYILGFALAYMAWRQPWKSALWLRLCIFSFGLMLSNQLELPVLILGLWLIAVILNDLLEKLADSKRKQLALETFGPVLTAVLVFLAFGAIFMGSLFYQPHRELKPEWVGSLQELETEGGIMLVGNALAFTSTFFPGAVIENPPVILEASEEKLNDYMVSAGISRILVDVEFIRNWWISIIKDGQDPDLINLSVIARLIQYSGKSVETKTLEISEVRNFKLFETGIPGFVIVESNLK